MAWFALDCRDIVPTLLSWWFRLVVNCSPSNPFHMIDCFSVNYRPKATSQPTIRWMMKYHQKAWAAISPNSCWTTANGQPLHNCLWNCAKPSMFFDFLWRLVAARQLLQIWSTQYTLYMLVISATGTFLSNFPEKCPKTPPKKKQRNFSETKALIGYELGRIAFALLSPSIFKATSGTPRLH